MTRLASGLLVSMAVFFCLSCVSGMNPKILEDFLATKESHKRRCLSARNYGSAPPEKNPSSWLTDSSRQSIVNNCAWFLCSEVMQYSDECGASGGFRSQLSSLARVVEKRNATLSDTEATPAQKNATADDLTRACGVVNRYIADSGLALAQSRLDSVWVPKYESHIANDVITLFAASGLDSSNSREGIDGTYVIKTILNEVGSKVSTVTDTCRDFLEDAEKPSWGQAAIKAMEEETASPAPIDPGLQLPEDAYDKPVLNLPPESSDDGGSSWAAE